MATATPVAPTGKELNLKKGQARTEANAALRKQYPDDWEKAFAASCKTLGVPYEKKPSAKERALAAIQTLLDSNPDIDVMDLFGPEDGKNAEAGSYHGSTPPLDPPADSLPVDKDGFAG